MLYHMQQNSSRHVKCLRNAIILSGNLKKTLCKSLAINSALRYQGYSSYFLSASNTKFRFHHLLTSGTMALTYLKEEDIDYFAAVRCLVSGLRLLSGRSCCLLKKCPLEKPSRSWHIALPYIVNTDANITFCLLQKCSRMCTGLLPCIRNSQGGPLRLFSVVSFCVRS